MNLQISSPKYSEGIHTFKGRRRSKRNLGVKFPKTPKKTKKEFHVKRVFKETKHGEKS